MADRGVAGGFRDQDLHAFLDEYPRAFPEDVLEVKEVVEGDQVLSAVAVELWEQGRAPMLVFPEVEGLSVPVVTNVFGSRERIARILGTTPDSLHRTFHDASTPTPLRFVDDGPVLEDRRTDFALDRDLPMLKHFDQDRAPYLTSAIVVAEDPETGAGNASYHRCMVSSPTALATSLHSRGHLWRLLAKAAAAGSRLPVAVVIGGHPIFMLACAARVGMGVDEREIAGGLFGAPLDVVRTPEHGIGVPASADLVLEGTIDPEARTEEGPFGEFSGYASSRSTNNVIEVTTMLRREEPVLLDVVSGNAPDHLNLGRVPRESEMAERLRERFPEVIDIEYPASGTHFHCYVAVRAGLPGQARQIAIALLGWDPYLKLVVVVDEDVDIRREEDVLWALATRFQADRDIIVLSDLPGSLLDPSSVSGSTARLGIDATRPPGFDAERVRLSEAARARAREILSAAGLGAADPSA